MMCASVLFDFSDAARQLRMLILLGKVGWLVQCAWGVGGGGGGGRFHSVGA